MDFQKSKLFLDKLNREFTRLSKDPDNVVRLDIDIMASYLRDLYDALYDSPVAPVPVKPEPPRRETKPETKPEIVLPPPVVQPEVPVVVPEVAENKPKTEAKDDQVPRSGPIVSTSFSSGKLDVMDPETEALFEEKAAVELSDRLSGLPIADLKKAVALNDRLLYIRELFGDQGPLFDTALSDINMMGNFSDAQNYMVKQYVKRFEWCDPKRVETAKTFIKLVRRRFK